MNPIHRPFVIVCLLAALPACGQLSNPESIAYDFTSQRYFISNYGSGTIAVMDSLENISIWATGLQGPAGLTIRRDTLYCNSSSRVYSYSIPDSAALDTFPIAGAGFLNDITADDSLLYVSDSQRGRIHRINPYTHETAILAQTGLARVNGIVFDPANDRLLTCSMVQNAPISQVTLPEGEVTVLYSTTFSVLDGITLDARGFVYVSSIFVPGMGGDNNIYRWDPEFADEPELIGGGYAGPADIYYNQLHERLAIPVFDADTIEFIDFGTGAPRKTGFLPEQFRVDPVYPNPFNAEARFSFYLPRAVPVQVALHNLLGQEVARLLDQACSPGDYILSIPASNLAGGRYFVRLIANGEPIAVRSATLLR